MSHPRGFGAAPNKAIPANPRYAQTRAKLDTGPNMRKILESQGSSIHAHKKQKDEFFVRLKPSVLGRLLQSAVEEQESIYSLANEDARSVATSVVPESAASASGAEGNIIIFDMRPFEQFEACHVYGARHLEPAMMNRSTNNLPREVFYYKGEIDCDKMVVIYDEDGKAGREYGNKFDQLGVHNTYVVSGGFLALCATAPHILVGQPPPADILAGLMARAGIKVSSSSPSARSHAGPCTDRCSTAGSVRTQDTSLTSNVGAGARGRAWK